MSITGFDDGMRRFDWPVTRGQASAHTFTFSAPPGTVTAVAGEGRGADADGSDSVAVIEADVSMVNPTTAVITWAADDIVDVMYTQWRLRLDGEDWLGGAMPEATPDTATGDTPLAVTLPAVENLAVTITRGGAALAGSFTVPLVGQWNNPVITAAGIPEPHLSLIAPMGDVTPTPAEPIHIIASMGQQPGAPLSDPDLGDLPTSWTIAQEVGGPVPGGGADVFSVLLYPAAYIPPEVVGIPTWFKFEQIDGDGYGSVCYAYVPGGPLDAVDDVDLFIFDSVGRYEMTIEASPDDTTAGPAAEQTIHVTGSIANALNSARLLIAALTARVVALEAP